MIGALVWKEYREHRAIWLSLAIVSGAALFGLTRLMAPEGISNGTGTRESLQAVAALLAWTYGLVCGSMLLANEHEAGTMTFLDMLPVRRLQLWLVKGAIGAILFLGQVAVLTGFVMWLDLTENGRQMAWTVATMLFFGLFGMAWGLVFSARGESVLNVIGLAIVGQVAASLVVSLLLIPMWILTKLVWRQNPPVDVFFVFVGVVMVIAGPIVGSARLFSRTDRLRGRGPLLAIRRAEVSVWASWLRLLWLNYAQNAPAHSRRDDLLARDGLPAAGGRADGMAGLHLAHRRPVWCHRL